MPPELRKISAAQAEANAPLRSSLSKILEGTPDWAANAKAAQRWSLFAPLVIEAA